MADITSDKLPLPLTRRQHDKLPSDRLPLILTRKLGTLDVITPVNPIAAKKPNPTVMTHQAMTSQAVGVNMGGQVSIRGHEAWLSWHLSWGDVWSVASGYDMAVRHFTPVADGVETYVNTPYLIGNIYQHTWQGLITLAYADMANVGGGVGLFSCNLVKYGAKRFLHSCTPSNLTETAGIFGDNTHRADSMPIAHDSTYTITHSTPVPCRYYPIPEPEPDKPILACQIRPSSDRLPLALRRKRG